MQRSEHRPHKRTIAILVLLVLTLGFVAAHGNLYSGQHTDASRHHTSSYTDNGYTQVHTGQEHELYGDRSYDGSTTQADQQVYQHGDDVYVERSARGDGYVQQRTERDEDGFTASQQVTHTERSTVSQDRRQDTEMKNDEGDKKYKQKPRKTVIIISDDRGDGQQEPPANMTADTVTAGNETTDGSADNGTAVNGVSGNDSDGGQNGSDTFPPGVDINDTIGNLANDTLDNATDGQENMSEENGTDIGGNGQVNGGNSDDGAVTDIGGGQLIGNEYQTQPRANQPEPPVTEPRRGFLEHFLDVLRSLFQSLQNWFARLGTL